MTLDSSDFKRGLKSASGVATSFSKTTSSAFDNVDDEASGAARAVDKFKRSMLGVGGAATSIIVPVNRAAGAIDNAGDEAQGTTRAFGFLAITTTGLSGAFGVLTTTATGAAGAIGLITLALAPLLPVIITAAGALGALATIFGVIVGTGIAAYMKQTGTSIKSVVKTVKQAAVAFGKQFVPLIKDAVALLPSLIKRISNAVGSLKPFVHALRVLGSIAYKVLPPLIGLFFDLAKAALPFFLKAAKFIGKNLVPALRALFKAGQRAAGEVYRLAKALFRTGKSLAGLAGWVGRFAVALYDLAAAALGVGKLTKELKRVKKVIRQGLRGAFQWLSTTGVQLVRQAFSLIVDAARALWGPLWRSLPKSVRKAITKVWKIIKRTFKLIAGVLQRNKKKFAQFANSIMRNLRPLLGAAGLGGLALILSGPVLGAFRAIFRIGTRIVGFFSRFAGVLRILLSPLTRIGLFIGSVLVSGLSTLTSVLWGLVPAFSAVSLSLSGILIPLGLIAAAVAGLWLAWKTNFLNIRNITKKVIGVITALINGDLAKAQKRFKQLVNLIGLSWKRNIEPLLQSAKRIFGQIKRTITGAINWVLNKLIRPTLREWSRLWAKHMGHIEEDTRQLTNFIKGVLKVLGNIIDSFTRAASAAWRKFGDEILTVTRFIWDMISAVIGTAMDVILTTIDVITDLMAGDWKGALKALKGLATRIFGGIVDFIVKWGSRFVGWIADIGKDMWKTFKGWVKDVLKAVKSFFGDIINYLTGQFWKDLTGAIDSVFDAAWKRIHKFGTDAWNTITNFFGDIINYFKTDFLSDIVSALSNAAKQAVQTFKQVFNSHIPDKITIPSVSIGGHTIGGGSIDLPELHSGGTVTQTGLFVLEAGETVVPGDADMPYSGSGSSQNVTVVNEIALDADATEDLLRGKTVETVEDLAKEAARRDARLGGSR